MSCCVRLTMGPEVAWEGNGSRWPAGRKEGIFATRAAVQLTTECKENLFVSSSLFTAAAATQHVTDISHFPDYAHIIPILCLFN